MLASVSSLGDYSPMRYLVVVALLVAAASLVIFMGDRSPLAIARINDVFDLDIPLLSPITYRLSDGPFPSSGGVEIWVIEDEPDGKIGKTICARGKPFDPRLGNRFIPARFLPDVECYLERHLDGGDRSVFSAEGNVIAVSVW